MSIHRFSVLKLIIFCQFIFSPSQGADFTTEFSFNNLFSLSAEKPKAILATPLLTKPTATLNSLEFKLVETPTPPKYYPLTTEKSKALIDQAKTGEKIALKTLLKRVFWCASINPFTLEDVLRIPNCQKKALSEKGYLYWNLIDLCDGFNKFPGLEDKIKNLATHHNSVTAQYMWGLITEKSWRLGGTKESAQWYQKAADQKYAPAQLKLALMYKNGEGGLDQSEEKKIKFSNLAKLQGYLPAMYFYAGYLWKVNRSDYGELIMLDLLFNSCWGAIPTQYRNIYSQYWCFNDRIKKIFYLDTKILSVSISNNLFLPESYFTKINQLRDEISKDLEVLTQKDQMQIPEEVKKIYPQIRDFLNMIPEVIDFLRNIEPGFKITCTHPTPLNKNNLENTELALFFKEGELIRPNGEKILYQNIGFQNNKYDIKIECWEKKCLEIIKSHNEIVTKNTEIRDKYENKIKERLHKKNALETLEKLDQKITSAEADFIPNYLTVLSLKTRMNEIMITQLTTVIPDPYSSLCKNIEEILSTSYDFVLEGIPQRNKEFIEYYEIVMKKS